MQGILSGEVDFETALGRMSRNQRAFIESEFRYSAAVGGFGSGKTVALCLKAILLGMHVPMSRILVGRLNFPALNKTTRQTFLELFPVEWAKGGMKGWQETKNILTAVNGSEYIFSHLDLSDPNTKGHIRSLNLNGIAVDEASEINEEIWRVLVGRLRRHVKPEVHMGMISSNPAGQDWMWRLFFKDERAPEVAERYKGFMIPTTENKNQRDGYLEDMLAIYPEDWRERFIFGSFADFSDLIYKDWDFHVHVYDSTQTHEFFQGQFDPPKEWPVIVGLDIGGVDPWAIVFLAIAPNGMLFQFDEIYSAGILVRDVADKYHAIMKGRNFEALAFDYENQQAMLELSEHGIGGARANKDVKAGIFTVGKYLHIDPRLDNPFTKAAGSPRLFISSKCTQTLRELPSYKWEKDRNEQPTGKPVDKDDHSCDALRYCLNTLRPEPEKVKACRKWESAELVEAATDTEQMLVQKRSSRLHWYLVEQEEQRKQRARKRPTFYRSGGMMR